MDVELSPYRFPIDWAEDVVMASATQTRVTLHYHMAEQYPCMDGVGLGYAVASDFIRAAAERIEDQKLRAGIVTHVREGLLIALEQEVGPDGLLVE